MRNRQPWLRIPRCLEVEGVCQSVAFQPGIGALDERLAITGASIGLRVLGARPPCVPWCMPGHGTSLKAKDIRRPFDCF